MKQITIRNKPLYYIPFRLVVPENFFGESITELRNKFVVELVQVLKNPGKPTKLNSTTVNNKPEEPTED